MDARSVYMNWAMSSYTGWGVYGLYMALHWCQDPDLCLYVSGAISRDNLALDALRMQALEPVMRRSAAFQAKLAGISGQAALVQGLALNAFDEGFVVGEMAHDVRLLGEPTVAVAFFETTRLAAEAIKRAAQYPVIVTGSSWTTDILRAHGLTQVRKVIQGADPTLFNPAPRLGLFPDRFKVFSGGKLERRKGQDLVLAAFRRFAARRPDALLVTAWHSPFNAYAKSLDSSGLAAPVPSHRPGELDIRAWAGASGVGPDHIIDLGMIPNARMPALLREMDIALFPNRAEGGTNMVAMEAMGCGTPCILSANTGHLDLIEDDNCYPLVQQGELAGAEGPFEGVSGWGECDVDEIVETLERAYLHRQEARERGLRGAVAQGERTWARTAASMKEIILSL